MSPSVITTVRAPRARRPGPVLAALLALAVGACGSGAVPTTFDLTALPGAARSGAARRSIVVAEPVGLQPFEADRIIVREAGGSLSFLGGGQWADRLPRLMQARLVQSLENTGRLRSVSRPGDKVVADTILVTEIRSFDIAAGSREAVVDISAKLVADAPARWWPPGSSRPAYPSPRSMLASRPTGSTGPCRPCSPTSCGGSARRPDRKSGGS